MELELVGGTIDETPLSPTQSYIDDEGNYVNTYSDELYNSLYQPPKQSGFANFMNDFFTPQRINAIGGLFTKKPQQFPNPTDYRDERNYTGVLIITLSLIAIIVLTIVVVRKRKK